MDLSYGIAGQDLDDAYFDIGQFVVAQGTRRKQRKEIAIAHNERAIIGEIRAEGKCADDTDSASRQFGLRALLCSAQKPPAPPIDDDRIRLPQLGKSGSDVREQEHRLVRIECQDLNRIWLVRLRVFPQGFGPFAIDRRRRRDTGTSPGYIKVAARKWVLAAKPKFGGADQDNVGIEAANNLQCALEKCVAESELHKHQQYGESDPHGRAQQAPSVVEEISPGKRYPVPNQGR